MEGSRKPLRSDQKGGHRCGQSWDFYKVASHSVWLFCPSVLLPHEDTASSLGKVQLQVSSRKQRASFTRRPYLSASDLGLPILRAMWKEFLLFMNSSVASLFNIFLMAAQMNWDSDAKSYPSVLSHVPVRALEITLVSQLICKGHIESHVTALCPFH